MSGELWLAEGFTQYYGPLALQRAGLVDLASTARTLRPSSIESGRRQPGPSGALGRRDEPDGAVHRRRPHRRSHELVEHRHLVLPVRRRDRARARPDAARALRRPRHARRLHARDVAHATASRAAPRRLRRSSLHDRRCRSDAGRGQRRPARSRATSSRATSRGTRSPTTRGCWRAPASRAQAQPGPRLARRSASRIARRLRASPALVPPTWPIYAAGLDQDDELQQVDGQRIDGDGDVAAALQRHKPGDTIADRVRRSHRRREDGERHAGRGSAHRGRAGRTRGALTRGAEGVPRPLAGGEIDAGSLASAPRRGPRRHRSRARPQGAGAADRRAARSSSTPAAARPAGLEARLAGVVVAALKEAFDRDTRRLELEREQLDAERAARRARAAARAAAAGRRPRDRPAAAARRRGRHGVDRIAVAAFAR